MKKIVGLMVTLCAVAGMACADIVDGSFNGASWAGTSSGNFSMSMTNKGWYTFTTSGTNAYNWGAGQVSRDTRLLVSGRGFGQIFSSTMTGSNTLSISWSQDDVATANQVRFSLWGIKSATGGITGLSLGGYSSASSNTNLTQLAYFYTAGGDYSATTYSTNFNAGTGYDYYAIGIYSDADATAVSFIVSDVNITSVVPEPATIGMLGIGALVSVMGRKFLRK